MSAPTQELIDELFREKVRAARSMSMEERLLAGARMFDTGCDEIRRRIHASFPNADQTVVDDLLRQVLRFAERHGVL